MLISKKLGYNKSIYASFFLLFFVISSHAQDLGVLQNWSGWVFDNQAPTRGQLYESQRPRLNDTNSGLTTFNYPMRFRFLDDAETDIATGKKRLNQHFGIDINYGTDRSLDFSALRKQAIEFVYVRASVGKFLKGRMKVDANFPLFWSELKKHSVDSGGDLHRGAYHFLMPGSPGNLQAQLFIEAVEKTSGGTGLGVNDLPPAMDLESTTQDPNNDAWLRVDPTVIIDEAMSFLATVDKHWNRKAVLYINPNWWGRIATKYPAKKNEIERLLKSGHAVWVADYATKDRLNETPDFPTKFWQFTAAAYLKDGYPYQRACQYKKEKMIKGKLTKWKTECLDASVFQGTTDEFSDYFGFPK